MRNTEIELNNKSAFKSVDKEIHVCPGDVQASSCSVRTSRVIKKNVVFLFFFLLLPDLGIAGWLPGYIRNCFGRASWPLQAIGLGQKNVILQSCFCQENGASVRTCTVWSAPIWVMLLMVIVCQIEKRVRVFCFVSYPCVNSVWPCLMNIWRDLTGEGKQTKQWTSTLLALCGLTSMGDEGTAAFQKWDPWCFCMIRLMLGLVLLRTHINCTGLPVFPSLLSRGVKCECQEKNAVYVVLCNTSYFLYERIAECRNTELIRKM